MKVCSFCGTENPNNAVICEKCGAHEFKHKCNNCGTLYSEGEICPECGVKANQRPRVCPNCGREYYSNTCPTCGYVRGGGDNGTTRADNSGAKNERATKKSGRSTAKAERSTPRDDVTPSIKPAKKRKTWLWVLGWIFIFPLPLTILLVKNKKMNKAVKIIILIVAWLFYLFWVLVFGTPSPSSGTAGTESNGAQTTASSTENNIKSMKFLHNDNVTVKVGATTSVGGYLKINAKNTKNLVPEDVILVSENPEVATISLKDVALNDCFYCDVTGVGGGETQVYATSKDGTIVSDFITVTVPQPILIESIEIQDAKAVLVIGEKTSPKITISPYNAEDKNITWTSSDEAVVTVDSKGAATAVGGGTATVTATSRNGVAASYTVSVDGTKHLMNLRVTHPRQDNVNIGDEWSFTNEINGERVFGTIGLAPGENLTLHTRISEDDDNPDIGENTAWYAVTEADLINGFAVSMDVYVTENGGKNSGQSAHFVVTYSFTPAS